MDQLRHAVQEVSGELRLKKEAGYLRRELRRLTGLDNIIGQSPKMRAIFDLIQTVAPQSSRVLITGESGTGKELVARAIHENSARAQAPFITVNCGAFPETLLESELFGYMKGAFTGANESGRDCFRRRTAARCSWTKSANMSPDHAGEASTACCRKARCGPRQHGRRQMWMFGSLPRRIKTWKRTSPGASFARTFFIASA